MEAADGLVRRPDERRDGRRRGQHGDPRGPGDERRRCGRVGLHQRCRERGHCQSRRAAAASRGSSTRRARRRSVRVADPRLRRQRGRVGRDTRDADVQRERHGQDRRRVVDPRPRPRQSARHGRCWHVGERAGVGVDLDVTSRGRHHDRCDQLFQFRRGDRRRHEHAVRGDDRTEQLPQLNTDDEVVLSYRTTSGTVAGTFATAASRWNCAVATYKAAAGGASPGRSTRSPSCRTEGSKLARQKLQEGPYLDPPIAAPLSADATTTAILMWNPLQYTKFYGDEATPGRIYCVKAGGLITTAATGALTISPGSPRRTLRAQRSAHRSRRPFRHPSLPGHGSSTATGSSARSARRAATTQR
jgi:hypothetical protein